MKKMLVLPLIFCTVWLSAQKKREPIIDMHIHANKADFAGMVPMIMCIHNKEYPATASATSWGDTLVKLAPQCPHQFISDTTDDLIMNHTLAIMNKRNIYGVTSGRLTEKWKAAAPGRIITSVYYRADGTDLPADSMRIRFKNGSMRVFGEIAAMYRGIAADDSSLAPYWAFAEEMDIPVGIHIGPGPIGAPYLGWPEYTARLHSPFQLEPVLRKHPNLRVYIMHAAWPMIDELLAMMWTYPQVYVDISGIITDLDQSAFYPYLKRIVESGFGKRVMFGSDQMIWPQLIEEAIKVIEQAPFLNKEQKRDIFYNNAARFLKLSKEEMEKHERG